MQVGDVSANRRVKDGEFHGGKEATPDQLGTARGHEHGPRGPMLREYAERTENLIVCSADYPDRCSLIDSVQPAMEMRLSVCWEAEFADMGAAVYDARWLFML